jgi:ATP-binding cassette subfamily F protein 3
LISLQNIGFHFGGRYLYSEVNWQIFEGQRIGLVGPNGAGKSTLLRVISGDYTPSEGFLNRSNDCTIGFLNQDLLSVEYKLSIYEVALGAFEEALKIEEQLNEIYLKLADDSSEKTLNLLGNLQERFEALDGYNVKHKTEEVLEGLGFKTADLHRPFMEFSGGWRMRVLLAKILLTEPKLLLLDEPTNHLDLPSIEWLETYLQNYKGAVIVVSHDRYFLDRLINTTAEIAMGKLYVYPGNYSFYMEAKSEREELQQRQFENQQQYIKQQERFIERFKAKASKATQAQSRMKMLDKLERVESVETSDVKINLNFKVKHKSGRVLKKLKNVSKSYGENTILKNSFGEIQRGERIGLIGANGKGKTTLLRIIAGEETFGGEIETGYQVIQSFYAQHQLEALNVQNDLLSELDSLGTGKTENELRTLLGCFLFSGDDVFKKIKVLSGGEKARVALAKCLVLESNFLLLDEPTNHLDMQSIDILVQALQRFEGTVIFVSHDRHFISRVATKIWWIQDQELKEYPGTYDEYNYWLETKAPDTKPPITINPTENNPIKEKRIVTEESSAESLQKQRKVLEKKLAEIDIAIAEMKLNIQNIEDWLSNPQNHTNLNDLSIKNDEYSMLKTQLENLNNSYESTFDEILNFE